MKKNTGKTDRIVRIILAIVAAALYFTGTVTGTTGYIVLAVGAIMLITALAGSCPLYSILGINTCPLKNKE